MSYVRVKDESGHEFSEPENSPLIKKGKLKVVDRKAATAHPFPPKPNPFPKKTSPAGDSKKEG